jgi:hypothetical protein
VPLEPGRSKAVEQHDRIALSGQDVVEPHPVDPT